MWCWLSHIGQVCLCSCQKGQTYYWSPWVYDSSTGCVPTSWLVFWIIERLFNLIYSPIETINLLNFAFFLITETESFVALLFKTIENKEYLNVKKDGLKDEKKAEEVKQVVQPAQSSEAIKPKEKEKDKAPSGEEQEKEQENDDYISSTDEKQNGVQIQSSVVSEGTVVKPSDSEIKTNEAKDERRKENVSI